MDFWFCFLFWFGCRNSVFCFEVGGQSSTLFSAALWDLALQILCMMMSTDHRITVLCEVQPWPRNPRARNEFFRLPSPTFSVSLLHRGWDVLTKEIRSGMSRCEQVWQSSLTCHVGKDRP